MAAAGLPIGGLLVSVFGWRSVFFVNVPVAALAVVLGLLFVPRGARRPAARAQLPRFDLVGVLLFTVTIGALGAFFNDVRHPIWWLLAASVVAGVVLVWWESRLAREGDAAPFIDVRLIAHAPRLRAVYLRSFVLSTAVYSMLYGLSQWFEVSRGLDAALVGVAMLPQSGASAGAATLAGRTRNFRLLVTSVAGLFAVAATALALTSVTASIVTAVVASTFVGVAFGVGMVGNQGELYEASTAEQFGVASGLWRTSSYVGGFMAMAVMGLVYSDGVSDTGLVWFAGVVAVCALATIVPRRLVLPRADRPVHA